MDHNIKEHLGCRYYVRYMDDFVIFHQDKQFLWDVKKAIVEYLEGLRLSLHEGKCRIFKADQGVPFLGLMIFPNRRRLKRENFIRFKRKMRRFQESYRNGHMELENIGQSVRAWIGHAMHADTVQLRRLILEEVIF
jgi:hypothetical protein